MLTATHTRIVDQEHERVGTWMHAQGGAHWREGAMCIGCERNGELVAGTMYDFCNGASVFTHIVITGRMTRDWLWFIFYYPFVQLGCTVLIGLVAGVNRKAVRLVEHLGFDCLAPIPQADPDGDLLIYRMRKEDCRFLTRRSHEV